MLLILVLGGSLCGTMGLIFLKLFEIKTISIIGSGLSVSIDQNKITKNLLFFPAAKLRQQILHDQPLISEVIFKKKYPHTLIIEALPRVASARFEDGGRVVLVDKSGVILGDAATRSNLPLLIFNIGIPLTPGTEIKDKSVLGALSFINITQDFLNIENIVQADSLSLRATLGKTEIFFPQQGDLRQIQTTLQTLFSGFRIKGTLPTVVDLRFAKPIVTF